MILNRLENNKNGLFGVLKLPSGVMISTLELNYDNNKKDISSIPCGAYRCGIVQSPKFGVVYQVKDVPNRSHILIHAGNWISDIQGCILVGMSDDGKRLYDSKKALKLLMSEMANRDFELEIVENYAK